MTPRCCCFFPNARPLSSSGEGDCARVLGRRKAMGSAAEVRACLDVAEALGYVDRVDEELHNKLDHLVGTLHRLTRRSWPGRAALQQRQRQDEPLPPQGARAPQGHLRWTISPRAHDIARCDTLVEPDVLPMLQVESEAVW